MAATTKALEAKRDRLRLEAEIADLEAAQGLLESMPKVVTEAWNQLIDRTEYLRDDDRFGHIYSDRVSRAVDHYRGDNRPYWSTETELAEYRGECRWIGTVTETGIGIRDTLRNYVVGKGFEITVQPKAEFKTNAEAQEIAAKVNAWLAEQLEANGWFGDYEFEAFNSLIEDGEQVWLIEPDKYDERRINFSYAQPDLLTEPTMPRHVEDALGMGEPLDWRYGVAAPFTDSARALAYFVKPYDEEGQVYQRRRSATSRPTSGATSNAASATISRRGRRSRRWRSCSATRSTALLCRRQSRTSGSTQRGRRPTRSRRSLAVGVTPRRPSPRPPGHARLTPAGRCLGRSSTCHRA